MFSPWTAPYIPFWWVMSLSAAILITLSLVWGGKPQITWHWSDILLGIAIAAALWGVFWVGDKVSQWLFPTFARNQVNTIYQMKEGYSAPLLSALLLCLIGPAEELFWRGYIQRTLSFPIALAAYTLVHVLSLNFMLVGAAFVCGLAWGGLYRLMPQRFAAIIISHALWDAAVFVWFPI